MKNNHNHSELISGIASNFDNDDFTPIDDFAGGDNIGIVYDEVSSFHGYYDEHAEQDADNFFLGHLIARKMGKRGSKAPKVDKKLARQESRQKAALSMAELQAAHEQKMRQLDIEAQARGITPAQVATEQVAANRPAVEKFVSDRGVEPMQSAAGLAGQATAIHLQNVEDKQASGVPDFDVANDSVMQDYQEDSFNGENELPDNFLSDIFGAVIKAGKAFIDKVNKKRAAKGKAPLFKGKNYKKLAEKVTANQPLVEETINSAERLVLAMTKKNLEQAKEQSAVSAAAEAGVNEYKKRQFMDYLPILLVVALLIFLAGKMMK